MTLNMNNTQSLNTAVLNMKNIICWLIGHKWEYIKEHTPASISIKEEKFYFKKIIGYHCSRCGKIKGVK